MLSKDVCKHCINLIAKYSPWRKDDENNWENNEVMCPEEISHAAVYNLTKPPPKWCPSAFEHAMAAGMTDAE